MTLKPKRLLLFAVGLATIAAAAYLSQEIWRRNGLRVLQDINEQRVQLIATTVRAEVNRQDHLPVVLALDEDVRRALADVGDPAGIDQLNRKLETLSHEADTRSLYVIDRNGIEVASDDWRSRESRIGRDLSQRPYFVDAVRNGRSAYLGVEQADDRVRYHLAEAVKNPGLVGVSVVRIEFDSLENAWERAGERVLVTDKSGIVFLASDSNYKYRTFGTAAAPGAEDRTHYPELKSDPIAFEVLEQHSSGAIIRMREPGDGQSFLYQSMELPEYGWTIHRLTGLETIHADQRDGALIGGATAALIIFLLLYLLQRHSAYVAARKAGDWLKSEVEKRTQELRDANRSLQAEIEERKRTERQLRNTQNELVQAGKLAALGQMSAAIAHEINQPLAAIRTFLASTRIFAERGETGQVERNLDVVNGLAERMAAITSHLKTFARKSEPGRAEPVDVAKAVEGALFLTESRIKTTGARIEKAVARDVWVSGYAVQLEQVMVNLIANALDAAADGVAPRIGIRVWSSDDTVFIRVSDNGAGIPPELVNSMFDPFVTTKSVGKGLGLGLSISYGIVQGFHGRIVAANRAEGGAEFTVELPRLMHETGPFAGAVHA